MEKESRKRNILSSSITVAGFLSTVFSLYANARLDNLDLGRMALILGVILVAGGVLTFVVPRRRAAARARSEAPREEQRRASPPPPPPPPPERSTGDSRVDVYRERLDRMVENHRRKSGR